MTIFDVDPDAVAHVAVWAAAECHRQQSGELSVGWMVRGWAYAVEHTHRRPTEFDIQELGRIVEPRHNTGEYRKVNVRVGADHKGPWQQVPERMTRLVGFLSDPTLVDIADEWFRQYEEIHPFRDGNGRTGSILWNWLRDTLAKPEAPPDFWGDVE